MPGDVASIDRGKLPASRPGWVGFEKEKGECGRRRASAAGHPRLGLVRQNRLEAASHVAADADRLLEVGEAILRFEDGVQAESSDVCASDRASLGLGDVGPRRRVTPVVLGLKVGERVAEQVPKQALEGVADLGNGVLDLLHRGRTKATTMPRWLNSHKLFQSIILSCKMSPHA